MRTNHAKTLLAAFAMAAGLSGLAHADRGAAPSSSSLPLAVAHTGPRDPFTDGARMPSAEAAMLAVAAPAGRSVCKAGGFDPYTDGMATDRTDPYGNGARNGTRDPYTEGGGRITTAGSDCLYRQA
ncbi:MAG: hypothetical protein E6Q40_15575 [Cupriavidus sp.]|nr:MAG: hypothetical protein E6Q40_15575 [Cupriavidus sp.]